MDVLRLDWLHAADQGVSADFIGGLLWYVQGKLPARNIAKRCDLLWDKMTAWYDRKGINSNRLQTFTRYTIKKKKGHPKLKCGAGVCRTLVPFALDVAVEVLDANDPIESTVINAARSLNHCYGVLHAEHTFQDVVLQEHSTRCCLLFAGLQRALPATFKTRPKLHQFLELCHSGGSPSKHWNYRDEDFGGSVAAFARRRGSAMTLAGFSRSTLERFRIQPMVRLVARR